MYSNITYWLDETEKSLPDKVAFADENKELTFREVKQKALKLALQLVKSNCFKKPIAIYMEKSVDVLIAFFAAAYSGNFYSPIDVDMPISRVNKILEILNPEIIITKSGYQNEVKEFAGEIPCICIDEEDKEGTLEDYQLVYRQRDLICDTDLLYVLFTSGSTGTPKGVTICHRSVIDYIEEIVKVFSITKDDVFGNQAPFYFDNSVLDIYTTIRTGATMHIIPKKLFAWPVPLLNYLIDKKINTIFWVPSALIVVSKLGAIKKVNLSNVVKRVLFCGEVMPNKQLNIWRKYLPDALYANLYGPTEITDACTYYIVNREFGDEEPLPIGNAFHNSDVLVLNEENKLVQKDEIGELCVRGSSLSLGYYRNPDKTKEVFVQNPLNTAYPEVIYRTGDLVKYNEFGEIIYLSRKDFQIKHMGHRIELGEIENAVSSIEEVAMCCCSYDEKKGKIVLFLEEELTLEYVKEKIHHIVPDYMLPNRLIHVEKMPINANGKIDRTKLKELL